MIFKSIPGKEEEKMSKKCVNCGAELADDALFCTECGTKAEIVTDTVKEFGQAPAAPAVPVTPVAAPAPQPVVQPVSQTYYGSAPAAAPVAPAPAAPGAELAPVVKTSAFFWLDVLYCLPFVGFIACIIICAASKNPNIRHHAASKLVEILVILVLTIIIAILSVIAIKQAGFSSMNDLNDLLDSYGGLSNFY